MVQQLKGCVLLVRLRLQALRRRLAGVHVVDLGGQRLTKLVFEFDVLLVSRAEVDDVLLVQLLTRAHQTRTHALLHVRLVVRPLLATRLLVVSHLGLH